MDFTVRYLFNEIVTVALNLYFSYVCKQFASHIQPVSDAAQHYQANVNPVMTTQVQQVGY